MRLALRNKTAQICGASAGWRNLLKKGNLEGYLRRSFTKPVSGQIKDLMRAFPSALLVIFSAAIPVCFGASTAAAAKKSALDQQLQSTVHQYLTKYCVACHSGRTPAAQFDLTSYNTVYRVTSEFPALDAGDGEA